MDSFQIVVIIALISIILADNQSPDSLNVIENLIVAVGSILLTIATQNKLKALKKVMMN
jgi:flagellar motor component MotA